jgi:hypothetical protein
LVATVVSIVVVVAATCSIANKGLVDVVGDAPECDGEAPEVVVVVHWYCDLTRIVPTGW